MRPYSVDLRQRIVHAVLHEGQTQPQVAARFDVSLSSVQRYARLHKEQHTLYAKPLPGRKPAISKEQEPQLQRLLQSGTDWTLKSLSQAWHAASGTCISISALHRHLKRLGWRFKKRVAMPPSDQKKNEPPSSSRYKP